MRQVESDQAKVVMGFLEALRTKALANCQKTEESDRVNHYADSIGIAVQAFGADSTMQCDGGIFTPMEQRILNRLRASRGKIVSYDALVNALYFDRNPDECGDGATLKVFISKLRKKMRGLSFGRVETVFGFGYRLVAGDD